MTRKTFFPKTITAGLLLAAAAHSGLASAYFVVSLPGNAMTMSGVRYDATAAAGPAPVESSPATSTLLAPLRKPVLRAAGSSTTRAVPTASPFLLAPRR